MVDMCEAKLKGCNLVRGQVGKVVWRVVSGKGYVVGGVKVVGGMW